MGGIAVDKAILIFLILESLLHGNRPKSSSSVSNTNKIGSGIYTVFFGFTLWVLIYERSNRVNMTRLLLPALALYAIATAVSQLKESINYNPFHTWLRQAFDRRRIYYCECFHHIPRCTWWPYGLFRRFFESGQPPQTFILRSSNSVGRLLPGKKILLLSLIASVYMIPFRRSTGVHSYGKTIYG